MQNRVNCCMLVLCTVRSAEADSNMTNTGPPGRTTTLRRPLASFFSGTNNETRGPPRIRREGLPDGRLRRIHATGHTVMPDPPQPHYLADTAIPTLLSNLPSLPSCWSSRDKSSLVAVVGDDASEAHYTGAGKKDEDAASIRANLPIPVHIPIYYFEIEILNKGKDGFIGIGVCGGSTSLGRLPGWDKDSWGYHGDDGNLFNGSGSGRSFGPQFTQGDIIGVIVNRPRRTLQYTKNGILIGTAFSNLPNPATSKLELFPTVGFRTAGEQVKANFGAKPFKFGIDIIILDEQRRLQQSVSQVQLPAMSYVSQENRRFLVDGELTGQLEMVVEYLIYRGYASTAKALVESFSLPPSTETTTRYITHLHRTWNDTVHAYSAHSNLLSNNNPAYVDSSGHTLTDATHSENNFSVSDDVQLRSLIMKFVREGKLDSAVQLTQTFYSKDVLGNQPDLVFRIRCQKFVELIRERMALMTEGPMVLLSDEEEDDDEYYLDAQDHPDSTTEDDALINESKNEPIESLIATENHENTTFYIENNWKQIPTEDIFHSAVSSPAVNDFSENHQHKRFASQSASSRLSTAWSVKSLSQRRSALLKEALRQGRALQNDYREDSRPEIRKLLMETYALLAYSRPDQSPVAHMLDQSRRDQIALALNSAIMGI